MLQGAAEEVRDVCLVGLMRRVDVPEPVDVGEGSAPLARSWSDQRHRRWSDQRIAIVLAFAAECVTDLCGRRPGNRCETKQLWMRVSLRS